MLTYFISGHLSLSNDEFSRNYARTILTAMEGGAYFVVGDARGCDHLAQKVLGLLYPHRKVTVYHMLSSPRNLAAPFNVMGGYQSDTERDAAMTAASDKDIAWVRPGRETSGTAKNLARRLTGA